jgi:regulator of protease activity HflC (stomatin/prohibitin superfamily)
MSFNLPQLPGKVRDIKFPSVGLPSVFLVLITVVFFLPIWVWSFWRIEPESDQIAILIHKTGKDLPTGQILALEKEQKGIQLEVLPEGRYFRNPFAWGWEMARIMDIPAGKMGVLTRVYGHDLPVGKVIAEAGSKGIVADVLSPGKYRINPYAYDVHQFDAITIRPGHVGVVTSLIGMDVLDDDIPPAQRNQFLVEKGLKGVQSAVLDPGTYYLNSYMLNVVEVNLQSQRFEMSGEDAISFLTMDGFTVQVEGTIEFAMVRESAALVTHRVGEMNDVIQKVIMPRARGFSRIEGSKNPATTYIVGETRQIFQDKLEAHLREKCASWGVAVKSVLIRNIQPPDQIASIIRDREVAVQNAKKFDQQTEQAKSSAELVKQETLALQNKEKVEAETVRIKAVIRAEQDQSVKLTTSRQELEVAKLENEAANFQVQAIMAKAGAEQSIIRMNNEAQAGVLSDQTRAFGTGINLARYNFYQTLGPKIKSIVAGDQPEGLGSVFMPLIPSTKEVGR